MIYPRHSGGLGETLRKVLNLGGVELKRLNGQQRWLHPTALQGSDRCLVYIDLLLECLVAR